MVRPPYVDSKGMKKGAWSQEEDNKLRAYVMRYGHWNWRLLPKYAGLARCGKSCRLRWVNYLKPGVKRGDFNKEEEELIIKLHAQLGNKWSAIAANLPGRTDNEIKNFYHTRIEKTRKRTPSSKLEHDDHASHESASQVLKGEMRFDANKIQESTPSFDDKYSSPHKITQSSEVDLWSDLFLASTNCNIQSDVFPPLIDQEEFFSPHELHYSGLSSSDSSYISTLDWIGDDEHCIMSSEYVAPSIQGSFWSESCASNASNYQSSENPTQDQVLGDFYDPLFQDCFDYGMSLFS